MNSLCKYTIRRSFWQSGYFSFIVSDFKFNKMQEVQDIDNILRDELLAIDKLQELGINQADIQKMRMLGITTVRSVQMATSRSLLKIKGFSEAKVDKIKDCATKLLASGFISATELEVRRQCICKISTGSKEFDKLLAGGIQVRRLNVSQCQSQRLSASSARERLSLHILCISD
jgi:hypothetical protein